MRTAPLTLLLAALTSAASAQTLFLNGKPSPEKPVVLNGKTYVPVTVLPALGVPVNIVGSVVRLGTGSAASPNAQGNGAGGAGQKASVEGCVNEWLFNGIWRLRVTKVDRVQDQYYGEGWGVTMEIRNGTTETLTMDNAGIIYNGAVEIDFADGNSWSKSWREGWQDKTYAKMLQGGGTVYQFKIFPESKMDAAAVSAYAPQKFQLEVEKKVRADRGVKVGFTVPDPSFRVNLTCRK
ncbi:hypothetical protein [Deinococcus hopiensis]|uniref:Uncharacterized protein n=1 Tax=Deinococcus hopiensis KR-140 TaxID=695939 RepID=A0A1W1UKT3_9DEIO|nr:hypothetical protein [Deinococcus hopiensis]SMB81633.1 hypothetical protein SAMN00790413_04656 [Deinococcus hopiensis KR-140]